MLALLALFIFAALMHSARAQTSAITITSSPATGDGFIEVDGTPVTTPQLFNWNAGDTHTLYALSPISDGSGTQYVFTSWSATSFGSSTSQTITYTVLSSDETVTATYATQYQVTFAQTGISSDAGSNPVLMLNGVPYAYSPLPTSVYVDSGTAFSWTTYVAGVAGERFAYLSDSGLASPIVTSGTDAATYKTQYQHTITSSPATGSGYVTVDGGGVTTPYTTPWWDSGSSHTLTANSPVTLVSGQSQYTYSSWSDSGAQSHSVSPTAVTTYTAVFQLQYFFSVSSANDNPTGAGWYNAGSSVSSSVTRPVSGGTGIQYETTGWTGTGSLNSGGSAGSSSTGSFTLNAYTTCTWNWKTQYQATFTQTGLNSDVGTNTVLTVGSTDYNYTSFPVNIWVDSGTSFAWAPTVSGVSGEQFALTSQSGTSPVTASGTFSATYQKQYLITFNENGVGSVFTGTVVTVAGSNYGVSTLPHQIWWNAGSGLSFSFASPLVAGSTQYVWSSTSGLLNLQAGTLTVTASGSVAGNYQAQYQVTFDKAGVSSDYTGSVVTIDSTIYSATQLPINFTWNSGSTHNFDFTSYLVVGSTTKQYVWTSTTGDLTSVQSGTLTVTTYGSVIGNFKTQYYLSVSSQYDSPSPPKGFFDSGSGITESVTSPASGGQYICTGWTGTGSVPTSGSTTSATFTITAASSITWNWQSSAGQLSLTVSSPHGNPNPSVGKSYWTSGSSVNCSVSSPVTEDYYVWTCTGWTGTGSVPPSGTQNTVTFTITQDSTINWTWTGMPVKYNLTVSSAYGSPNPGVGVHSYNGGQYVTCNVSSPVAAANGSLWACTGWTGTGSVPATGAVNSVTFNFTQDSSITWNWQIFQYTLNVNSLHGNPSPPPGLYVYNSGTNITCSAPINSTEGNTTWICTGWTGTGSVPPSGPGNSVSFQIYKNSTITWLWHNSTAPQYDLTVFSQYGGNPIPGGDHLYDEGQNIPCSVDASVNINGTTYVCTGWSGTGSVLPSGTGNSFNFTITQNSTITWNWQIAQWTLTVSSAHGNPVPTGGEYNDGTNVNCNVTSPVIEAGISYTCTGWTGTGSVPSNGAGTSATFTINQNSSITWIWIVTPSVQWKLQVSSPHGNPSPSVGDHLYNDGDSVTCNVTSPVSENGTVWTCTGWSGTGSVQSSGTTTSVTFSITENSTITWNWVTVSPVQWTLTVVSAHGHPSPSVGDHSYSDGTTLSCNVSSPVVENSISYVCTGWIGNGSVSSSGSGTSTSFTLTENSMITWTWQAQPTIESSDSMGTKKDVFSPGETVYITGTGYVGDQIYSIYFVNATTWVNGMAIPERIQGTATSVSTDSSGIIHLTLVCNETLTEGYYDILINVNGTSTYDAKVDALYSVQVSPQAQSSSEYIFGTILGLTGCFAALGAFRIYKRKRQ